MASVSTPYSLFSILNLFNGYYFSRHLQIFTQYATECNVSVEQYKRIAFRASANLVQYQNDLDTVNCTLVEDNYNTLVKLLIPSSF